MSRQAVSSLDQLYSQALGTLPILHAKCAAWAAKSGGALDAADGGAEGVRAKAADPFAGPGQTPESVRVPSGRARPGPEPGWAGPGLESDRHPREPPSAQQIGYGWCLGSRHTHTDTQTHTQTQTHTRRHTNTHNHTHNHTHILTHTPAHRTKHTAYNIYDRL